MASTATSTPTNHWATQGVRPVRNWDEYPQPKRQRVTEPAPAWVQNTTGPLCAIKRLANTDGFKQRPMTATAHGSKEAVDAYVEQVARGEEARERVLSFTFREGIYMIYHHLTYAGNPAPPQPATATQDGSGDDAGYDMASDGEDAADEDGDPTYKWSAISRNEFHKYFLEPYCGAAANREVVRHLLRLPAPSAVDDLLAMLDATSLKPLHYRVHAVRFSDIVNTLAYVDEIGEAAAARVLGWDGPSGGGRGERMVALWCVAMRHLSRPWTRPVDPLEVGPETVNFAYRVAKYYATSPDRVPLQRAMQGWALGMMRGKVGRVFGMAVQYGLVPGNEDFRALRTKLAEVTTDYEAKLAKSQTDFDTKLADSKTDFKTKLAEATTDFKTKLAASKTDYEAKLSKSQTDFDTKLADATNDFKANLAESINMLRAEMLAANSKAPSTGLTERKENVQPTTTPTNSMHP
ncbi:hypothetical protein DFH27DRAFT_271190 [Peziza echinospora]|nr:hypothetical protein DFH27DRAFT_271190 [Peziza echinospora]